MYKNGLYLRNETKPTCQKRGKNAEKSTKLKISSIKAYTKNR